MDSTKIDGKERGAIGTLVTIIEKNKQPGGGILADCAAGLRYIAYQYIGLLFLRVKNSEKTIKFKPHLHLF